MTLPGVVWEQLRSGAWLRRGRVIAYARILLAVEILAVIFFTLGTHGLIVPIEHPTSTDFVSFYAAGTLADHGQAAQVYDRAAHGAMEHAVSGLPYSPYNYFFYPPTYLLVCALLPALPYLLSFLAFETVTSAAFLIAIRAIIGESGLLLPFVAAPALFWNFGIGQNAALTATLMAAATALLERRPGLAGVLFGCLCYKPHLALLVPVALLAGRHWKAFAAAATTVLVWVGLTLLLFGTAPWLVYGRTVLAAQTVFQTGAVAYAGLVSPFAAALLLGVPSDVAYGIQIAVSAALVGLVGLAWARRGSLAARAMMLTAAAIPAVPVVLFYDFLIPVIGLAWLVRLGRRGGFLPWEKTVACIVMATPILSRGIGLRFHLPLAPAACLFLVAIAFRRIMAERRPALSMRTPSSAGTAAARQNSRYFT